jgi:hypothetical protein
MDGDSEALVQGGQGRTAHEVRSVGKWFMISLGIGALIALGLLIVNVF